MPKSKIKICYVVAADMTVKFLLLSNLTYLVNKGYDVHVVCSKGKWLGELGKLGIKVKEIEIKRKISPLFDLVSLGKLFSYFKKEPFDIVHTFTPKPGLLGQMAAKFAGVPIICNTIFGFYFHEETPYLKKQFYIFIEKIASLFSDKIFFRNEEDFTTAQVMGIGTTQKNEYSGDGIDLDRFQPEKFSQDFITAKKQGLGINENSLVVGIVARLVREKGYLELFEAFGNVIKKFPNVILLAVGPFDPGKKDPINPNIVKEYRIEKNAVFLGERTDVDELYAVFDIFVLPSHREGFSHSIMEASAMAKPIIASDIRGCRGAIEAGRTGILVPLKNSQKLTEAMLFFLEHPEEAKGMGRLAGQKAQESFNEKQFFEKIDKEYQVLVSHKL